MDGELQARDPPGPHLPHPVQNLRRSEQRRKTSTAPSGNEWLYACANQNRIPVVHLRGEVYCDPRQSAWQPKVLSAHGTSLFLLALNKATFNAALARQPYGTQCDPPKKTRWLASLGLHLTRKSLPN
eukprot:5840117-Amphidinium_carterae.1